MAKRNAHKPKVTATQVDVNKAVAEAGDVKYLTAKQAEKQRKQEQAYWNSMITRKEARDLVAGAVSQYEDKLRLMFIATNSLIALVKDLGLCTDEKFNELSKPFVEAMYGPAPETPEEQESGGK